MAARDFDNGQPANREDRYRAHDPQHCLGIIRVIPCSRDGGGKGVGGDGISDDSALGKSGVASVFALVVGGVLAFSGAGASR